MPKNEAKPIPVKAKAEVIPEEENPYALMDAEDERQILAAETGVPISLFAYVLPYYQEGASIKCLVPKCKENGKKPHIHQAGVSITGTNEINRLWEGTKVYPVEVKVTRDFKGIPHYTAKAIAIDAFSPLWREGQASTPCQEYRQGKLQDKPFAQTSAINKAERNAIRKILPQSVLKKIADEALLRAEAGKDPNLTIEDVETLLLPALRARKAKQNAYFRNLLQRGAIGAFDLFPKELPPTTEIPPEGISQEELQEQESETPEAPPRPITDQQRKKIWAELNKQGLSKETAREFYHAACDLDGGQQMSFEKASQIIEDLISAKMPEGGKEIEPCTGSDIGKVHRELVAQGLTQRQAFLFIQDMKDIPAEKENEEGQMSKDRFNELMNDLLGDRTILKDWQDSRKEELSKGKPTGKDGQLL